MVTTQKLVSILFAQGIALGTLGLPGGAQEPARSTDAEPGTASVEFICDAAGDYPRTAVVVMGAEEPHQVKPLLNWLPEYYPDAAIAVETCEATAQKLGEYHESQYFSDYDLVSARRGEQSVVCVGNSRGCAMEAEFLFVLPEAENQTPGEVFAALMDSTTTTPMPARRGDFRVLRLRWLPF